jgi:PPM family protein phosphatase
MHTVERGDFMFIKCKTDKGMVRANNQDYVLSFRSSKYTLLIVADGMGGHNAGEIASKLAATTIRDYIFENYLNYEDKEELLRDAIVKSNSIIFENQSENEELRGMGTTSTCCIISNENLYIGHVGDSRAYLIGKEGIRKITIDHSYVQELIKNGSITEDEAQNHPKRNLITRAVGTEQTVIVDTKTETIQNTDIILICSDGLTSYVNNEEICEIVLSEKDEAVEKLVKLANERGGSDNISVIIAGLEDQI